MRLRKRFAKVDCPGCGIKVKILVADRPLRFRCWGHRCGTVFLVSPEEAEAAYAAEQERKQTGAPRAAGVSSGPRGPVLRSKRSTLRVRERYGSDALPEGAVRAIERIGMFISGLCILAVCVLLILLALGTKGSSLEIGAGVGIKKAHVLLASLVLGFFGALMVISSLSKGRGLLP